MNKRRQHNLSTIGLRPDDQFSDQMWADTLPASERAACADWRIMRDLSDPWRPRSRKEIGK